MPPEIIADYNFDSIGLLKVLSLFNNPSQRIGTDDDADAWFAVNPVTEFSDDELSNIFRQSALVQKIIQRYPQEAVEIGYEIKNKSGGIIQKNDEIILKAFYDASVFARLYKRCYLIFEFGIENIRKPINAGSEITGYKIEFNLLKENDFYIYDSDTKYHYTKVLTFFGKRSYIKDRKETDIDYADSILTSIIRTMRDYIMSNELARRVLSNVSYLTLGINNLGDYLRTPEGRQTVYERLQSVNQNRNINRTIAYDKMSEEINFITQSMAGFNETIQTLKEIFLSESGYPHEILFEDIPLNGLSSGAQNQLIVRYMWAKKAKVWIKNNWLPNYKIFFDRWLTIKDYELEIPFKVDLTIEEQAELEVKAADRTSKLISANVISNIEARTGYKTEEFTLNIELEAKPPEPIQPKNASNQLTSVNEEKSDTTIRPISNDATISDSFWENLAKITEDDLFKVAEKAIQTRNRDAVSLPRFVNDEELEFSDWIIELPIFEAVSSDEIYYALNFSNLNEAEEAFLDMVGIENYVTIEEVEPIEFDEDGIVCNLDRGCPKERIIRGAGGRFAGCKPGGTKAEKTNPKKIEAPKSINSKTNLAQLKAIAELEGIPLPKSTKSGSTRKADLVAAIKDKTGDKYVGKRGRPSGTKNQPKEKPQETKKPDVKQNKYPTFKGSTKTANIEKDLESWNNDAEQLRNAYKYKQNIGYIERGSKENSLGFEKTRAERAKKENTELEEKVKNNPYMNADYTRLAGNNNIGYAVRTDTEYDKIGVYDDKGNLQAAANITRRTKDETDYINSTFTDRKEKEKPHIFIEYLATAPWNIINTDKSVRGAGSNVIAEAVKLSIKEKLDGVELSPTPDARPFYEKLGFKPKLDSDDYMRLSTEDGKKLLEKLGM